MSNHLPRRIPLNLDPMIGTEEAAGILGLSESKMRAELQAVDGPIRQIAHRRGRCWSFVRADVERLAEQGTAAVPSAPVGATIPLDLLRLLSGESVTLEVTVRLAAHGMARAARSS